MAKFKIAVAVCYLLFCYTAAGGQTVASQDVFRDLPKGSWEYKALAKFKEVGIPIPVPSCPGYTRPKGDRGYTRYEFAVLVDITMRNLTAGKLVKFKPGKSNQEAAQFLHRFIGEYGEELGALKIDQKTRTHWVEYLKRFEPIDAPFADAPKDHWGSDSVERLRKLGILQGYPDGLFHG